MIVLTAEERQKFCDWLKQDAESDRLIIGQLEKMEGVGIRDLLAKRAKQRLAAKLIVAEWLGEFENQTISGASTH